MLEIKDVSKSFSKTLFQNISFTIEQGQRLSIMGPSGSGKRRYCDAYVGSIHLIVVQLISMV